MPIKSYFWIYFLKKIPIKSCFGCIFSKISIKSCFWTFFGQKMPKRPKNGKKIYFWQAKSAVERPFGHLTFRIFVKTAFFRFIFINFVKKRVFGIFGPQGWWLCIFVGLGLERFVLPTAVAVAIHQGWSGSVNPRGAPSIIRRPVGVWASSFMVVTEHSDAERSEAVD